jgi:tetratricopeptide (TPR) repeat protein
MAFGWLSGKKDPTGKALEKARKFAAQARWAEALSYFEEALGGNRDSAEARAGLRTCREHLVSWNLDETRAYAAAQDLPKAREHGKLALELAADEVDLQDRAKQCLAELGEAPPAPPRETPTRLFAPACACEEPCEAPEEQPAAEDIEVESLFDFYLESLSDVEREALEPLGGAFREGFVYLQQGETTKARPFLEQAADEAPTEAGPSYALGLLAALDRDQEAAIASFSAALQRDPDFAPAAHHRADVLREHGKPGDAVNLLTPWLENHPGDAEAWVLLSVCHLEGGDEEAGLRAASEAARHSRDGDPRPQLVKARALRALGRTDEALTELQAVAARRPDLLDALIPMGQLMIRKGGSSAERAAEVFKRCYRLDSERGWWHLLRVAEAYAARGWQAEAREMLAAAGRELPDSDEARAEWQEVSRALAG